MKQVQQWKNLKEVSRMKKLIIIGASGHGKVIANIAKLNGYDTIYFLDDDTTKKKNGIYDVVGTSQDINQYLEFDFIVGIGNSKVREKIMNQLEIMNVNIVSLIHPRAIVDETVVFEQGCVVMANAVINADSKIGKGCIINTSSSVDHDCTLKNYVHVCPGAHLAGGIVVDNHAWIGVGSSIKNNVKITSHIMIGAGGVVIKDLVDEGTYVGVPVKKVGK